MKKGLLSILASALLVVGCQDYDDQFSALETQINALASTVAGLSQVQSDLSSLAGTVNSLASTVNGLGDQIDTAVSDGLSDIQTDIEAIETAVADVASSEDVAAIDAALDTAQSDLTDLLAASSVFTGDVVVNSVNTLDAYLAMGAALNIVNGSVDIKVSTAMDQTKVQSLVDNILTVVQSFKYEADASTIAETTFNNLTGVQSLTITQGGGMRFPNLVSATYVKLNNKFASTVGVIHFGSLTSVEAFQTNAVSHTIKFTKATELHLTSLEYYPGGVLTIETDEGAAMPFALDDIDADGDTLTAGLTLTITGPASFTSTKIADGIFDFTDVKSVNLTDFQGAVTIGGDTESFTSNSLVSLSVDALTKIETVDVTGVVDPDATAAADKLGPAIDLDTLGDLETVKIAGIAASVNLGDNNNLTTVTISADVSGGITIDNNSDLTSVTVTGATASALDVDTNADLTALTVDLTWGNSGTGTTVDGDLDVTSNTSLETLTVSSDNLENLEVTGNTSLAKVDFTGVTKIGATGTAVVNIYSNNLTATKTTNSSDGTTDVADGAAGDLGSVTSTSGMSTLKTYLAALDADADSAAAVYFDKVESAVDSEGTTDSELTDQIFATTLLTAAATAQNATTVLLLTAGSGDGVAGGSAIAATRAFIVDLQSTGTFDANVGTPAGPDSLFANASAASTGASVTISNAGFTLAALQQATTVARFAAYNLTIASSLVANSTLQVSLVAYASATGSQTVSGERYVTGDDDIVLGVGGGYTAVASPTTFGVGIDDEITFSVGGNTVTVSPNTGGATTLTALAADIEAAWATKYGSAGTASASAIASITASAGKITVTPLDAGTAGNNLAVVVSVAAGTVTATSAKNLDWVIGATNNSNDNATVATDILVTITHNGVGADPTSTVSVTGLTGPRPLEITTTVRTNSIGADATDPYALAQQPGDAVAAEGASAGVADTTAAVSFSRVGWLG